MATLTDIHGFPQSLHANGRTVLQIRQWPIPSTTFPNSYSLIVLTFNTIQPELLRVRFNKPQVNNRQEIVPTDVIPIHGIEL